MDFPRTIGRAAAGLCVVSLLAACSRTPEDVADGALRQQLAQQYHSCIPLGWNPVPVAGGSFFPGANVQVIETGVWFPVTWMARIRTADRVQPQIRAIGEVLDALVRARMLDRQTARGASTYRLTMRAMPSFYHRNEYRNNLAGLPYLCSSRIVPRDVVRIGAPHRLIEGGVPVNVVRVTFAWTATADAPWAHDAFLRRHSIVLAPSQSPAIAELVERGDAWDVVRLSTADLFLPRLADPSAWPPAPPRLTAAGG